MGEGGCGGGGLTIRLGFAQTHSSCVTDKLRFPNRLGQIRALCVNSANFSREVERISLEA